MAANFSRVLQIGAVTFWQFVGLGRLKSTRMGWGGDEPDLSIGHPRFKEQVEDDGQFYRVPVRPHDLLEQARFRLLPNFETGDTPVDFRLDFANAC